MRHLAASDPNVNPEGWADENRRALECFNRAQKECYGPAQDLYAAGVQVPRPLLDRTRESAMRQSLCRKRAVSRGR